MTEYIGRHRLENTHWTNGVRETIMRVYVRYTLARMAELGTEV
ncbi:hypothetical protein SEA_EYRE_60 [Gordonia phage Eyre]|uniref:Uncharacterized protein n=1 Tax=Gordonia phage Eyre TaxID=1887646 RepID=A0A1B3AZZ0_9CAUD|nr:hypothetical protein BIZ73_gp60 [Gordonia phage Eyre]AOE44340.1 hypothetical protein SEA_EYRE_60 [Gordonia phage Eyre]